ncbi:hypothetical protein [Amycolatopsis sp. YIM 10]|uniref:hypothetical protein n=1 Tax=Amycolatopsis sp. YIM 10 TaxID=2653857 RepID=UPI00128FE229|nr:hypothetical protein [Amycolatopsis sp. YIM 10]
MNTRVGPVSRPLLYMLSGGALSAFFILAAAQQADAAPAPRPAPVEKGATAEKNTHKKVVTDVKKVAKTVHKVEKRPTEKGGDKPGAQKDEITKAREDAINKKTARDSERPRSAHGRENSREEARKAEQKLNKLEDEKEAGQRKKMSPQLARGEDRAQRESRTQRQMDDAKTVSKNLEKERREDAQRQEAERKAAAERAQGTPDQRKERSRKQREGIEQARGEAVEKGTAAGTAKGAGREGARKEADRSRDRVTALENERNAEQLRRMSPQLARGEARAQRESQSQRQMDDVKSVAKNVEKERQQAEERSRKQREGIEQARGEAVEKGTAAGTAKGAGREGARKEADRSRDRVTALENERNAEQLRRMSPQLARGEARAQRESQSQRQMDDAKTVAKNVEKERERAAPGKTPIDEALDSLQRPQPRSNEDRLLSPRLESQAERQKREEALRELQKTAKGRADYGEAQRGGNPGTGLVRQLERAREDAAEARRNADAKGQGPTQRVTETEAEVKRLEERQARESQAAKNRQGGGAAPPSAPPAGTTEKSPLWERSARDFVNDIQVPAKQASGAGDAYAGYVVDRERTKAGAHAKETAERLREATSRYLDASDRAPRAADGSTNPAWRTLLDDKARHLREADMAARGAGAANKEVVKQALKATAKSTGALAGLGVAYDVIVEDKPVDDAVAGGVGGVVGGMATGALAGAAFGPPGAVIGGFIGGFAGSAIGENLYKDFMGKPDKS